MYSSNNNTWQYVQSGTRKLTGLTIRGFSGGQSCRNSQPFTCQNPRVPKDKQVFSMTMVFAQSRHSEPSLSLGNGGKTPWKPTSQMLDKSQYCKQTFHTTTDVSGLLWQRLSALSLPEVPSPWPSPPLIFQILLGKFKSWKPCKRLLDLWLYTVLPSVHKKLSKTCVE